jgi:hypothetical protein
MSSINLPNTMTYGVDMGGTYSYDDLMNTTVTITGNTAPYNNTWVGGYTYPLVYTNENSKTTLQVDGDANFEGDVKIKGESLHEKLEQICEKLAILAPNEKLEKKWAKLRKLRNEYKKLEKEIIEQENMWDMLKK